ncbi:MAG TPA: hypothetical protein EYP98_22100, partial [Planctomycetes bacterium]|nr:hypothetical protein [Planctomycetota bacterium]
KDIIEHMCHSLWPHIAWTAHDHHIGFVSHGWNTAIGLAADLHLAAAIPVAQYVEYLTPAPYIDQIIQQPFALDDEGYLAIPTTPGLGIELDRDVGSTIEAWNLHAARAARHTVGIREHQVGCVAHLLRAFDVVELPVHALHLVARLLVSARGCQVQRLVRLLLLLVEVERREVLVDAGQHRWGKARCGGRAGLGSVCDRRWWHVDIATTQRANSCRDCA